MNFWGFFYQKVWIQWSRLGHYSGRDIIQDWDIIQIITVINQSTFRYSGSETVWTAYQHKMRKKSPSLSLFIFHPNMHDTRETNTTLQEFVWGNVWFLHTNTLYYTYIVLFFNFTILPITRSLKNLFSNIQCASRI